ncbi:MAG: hypothetical protein HY720_09410 [Planctomycetes bacterium]|nr:hypothetical protein [Planctomycetota bacterium]
MNRGGLSAQYMKFCDEERFFAKVDEWLLGVAVDPQHLANYKGSEGTGSVSGLTYAKSMFGGKYSGWIVLPAPPGNDGGATTLHELVHVYHFAIGSGDDWDGGDVVESFANLYLNRLGQMKIVDREMTNQLLAILESGQPNSTSLEIPRQRMTLIRRDVESWSDKEKRVLANIGGIADIAGLIQAHEAELDTARKVARAIDQTLVKTCATLNIRVNRKELRTLQDQRYLDVSCTTPDRGAYFENGINIEVYIYPTAEDSRGNATNIYEHKKTQGGRVVAIKVGDGEVGWQEGPDDSAGTQAGCGIEWTRGRYRFLIKGFRIKQYSNAHDPAALERGGREAREGAQRNATLVRGLLLKELE